MGIFRSAIFPAQARSRVTSRVAWLSVLALLAAAAGLGSLVFGTVALDIGSITGALIHPKTTSLAHTIVWDIRLPRLLIGACVGAGLGIAGAMLQMLFRNPLVDPYVTGVSAGAAVAAAIGIALGVSFVLVPALAFVGGLSCAALVAAVGAGVGQSGNLRLVLAGIAISSLCAAIVTIVLLRGEGSSGLSILGWLAGGISGRGWSDLQWTILYLSAGVVAGAMLTPSLNALRLGADAAAGLGLRVERARFAVLTAAALVTAACVAVSGIVGFVGLMVPHAARRLVGGDARWLMPASAVGGALVVVVADAIARTAVPATEVPLGVLLALVGVPFFLIIARRPVAL